MLARVLTVRFDPALEAFDDGPLREFLKAREAIAVREHFFVRNHVPYLAILVIYALAPPMSEPAVGGRSKDWESGWRSQLSEGDLPLFNALREWRAERASREGVPPYLVCTNKQLAAIVNARPQSLTKLGVIDGIGKARLEKYGQDLLAMLARPHNRPDSQDTASSSSAARAGSADHREERDVAEGSPDGRSA